MVSRRRPGRNEVRLDKRGTAPTNLRSPIEYRNLAPDRSEEMPMNSDSNDSMDAQILSREQRAIELLARETHTAIAAVQEVFLVEYKRLAEHAHIKSYLPLLACNSVRGILVSATMPGKRAKRYGPDVGLCSVSTTLPRTASIGQSLPGPSSAAR